MNQSRPSIKLYQRSYDPQAVPFKKRDRFLYADGTTSEEIGPSDDRRVRSRSHVANTEESNKIEIAQIEKKLPNTANDKVAHGASTSPVAMSQSEGRLPLATSASEEDPVKEKDRAKKPVIKAPSEPQGAFVVDGGMKQVDASKEVTEHEGDGGESSKSEPQGDGGNNESIVIDKKIMKQTKDVIQEEGGGDRSTGDQYTRSIKYIVISSSDSEHELDNTYSPIVSHGAPLNLVYPIPNPEGGSGGGGEGCQDRGSGDAEQNANHTIRVLGVDIPCRKDTVTTNTEDGDASGRPAADGSIPMRDSDVSRQQVRAASMGTGDRASSNSQEPLADGRGESSMRRPKSRLRLLGFDI
uniref:Uncharacterized protein n=1 Tax=Tanacetum cinerariifolium TaxID=118510 RepID=A0A6L2J1D5_TANCI|nr:hypothetical protein [Tanacetum cinerariifolium]